VTTAAEPLDRQSPPLAHARTPRAAEIADIILVAALQRRASAIWLEPLPPGKHIEAHRVSIEEGGRTVTSAVLGGGLGDAVIARFALIAGIDLVERDASTGRSRVRDGDHVVDVFVTTRPTEHGLSAEVRVLDERGFAAETTTALPAETAQTEPPPGLLPPGTRVGAYRILEVLGKGGMGIVYRGEHELLGRQFAIKVLRAKLLHEDPDSVRRFLREAQAAARIRHEGIVDVSDVASLPDGRPYLVMELLDGTCLADIVDSHGALQPLRAVRIIIQTARALGAAHKAGVVHRDLSLSNIFVYGTDEEERVKVVDFGAAHLLGAQREVVPDGPPGIVLGTPWYMAPEQARGLTCDARSDLYSLGVVLFELLSGRAPFDSESVRDVVRQHVVAPPPLVTSPLETLPEQLERVVARLLRKDPAERHQTAAALIEDLEVVERMLSRAGWRRWLPA
jgi:serine/threonine-protein kinase